MCRDSGLQEKNLLGLSPKTIWAWRKAFRESVKENENIKDNSFNEYRELNYALCGSQRSHGQLTTYVGGKQKLIGRSCSEPACTKCCDVCKTRTAIRYLNKSLALANAQGLNRFWTFVVTLPKEVEGLIPKGSNTRKVFMDELGKWVRRIFGLRAKDGLFFYANIHPVGDSDLMRDRFHVHIGVMPIAVRRSNGKAFLIHCDVDDLVNTEKALASLETILHHVFPLTQRGKAQFRAHYIPLHEKHSIPRLKHRLTYDLRGFGKDVELAPIFFDPTNQLVILEAGENGYGVYTVRQIAQRWRWIRSQRDLRPYGLLKQWNKYKGLLGVELIPDPEPEIIREDKTIIKRTYGRQWNQKTKQVKWIDEKKAFLESTGEELKGIEWGREGSEGIWQVKKAAPPG
jgi:hypothetical protein